MKFRSSIFGFCAVLGLMTVMIAGCSTEIPITMKVTGGVKLSGIRKIAIADFNSLPGDPFSGVLSADQETCSLVKQAVASSFYVAPMFQIVDMGLEKNIFDAVGALPERRYDAVVYGRVWWDVTPETKGQYPYKFTLSQWQKVPYVGKNIFTGKPIKLTANVTTSERDVVEMVEYRVRSATLMLSLSVYRIDEDGKLSKVVDTYEVASQGFMLINGEMKPKTGTIPNDLHAKLMLVSSVVKNLGTTLAPSQVTFMASGDCGDDRLEGLLKSGAFRSAKEYAMYRVRQMVGRQICGKLAKLLPEFEDPCSYPVPDSPAKKLEKLNRDSTGSALIEYFEDNDLDEYAYALGVCCEVGQDLEHAEEYYRFAFNVNPKLDYALGISRVDKARGETKSLKKLRKAMKE